MKRLRQQPRRRLGSGQSMVEFALVLPVLLLIVFFAVDFGRIFVAWVSLQNMARVGANFAASHPNTWDITTRAAYVDLMSRNGSGINCTAPSWPDPTYPDGRAVGDRAVVGLSCGFRALTPLVDALTGGTVTVSASSTFPVTYGCVADCPPPPPEATPPPPPDHCRTVPDMTGLSVDGARNLWVAAGFLATQFSPTGYDTRTVVSQTVTVPPGSDTCAAGKEFFQASVTVALGPLGSPTPLGCIAMPNFRGMTVSAARSAWTFAGFTGSFTPPTGQDAEIIIDQIASPDVPPDECVEPTTSVAVVYEAPPPLPPPAPCKVPSFVNTSTLTAVATWTGAGFQAGQIGFDQNKLPYTIKSQTRVGGTWISCSSSIAVSWK